LYSAGKLSEEMFVVEVCKMFGWTYDEYLDQPTFFLELISEKYRIDAANQANEMRKAKRK
jgi:hypothetical protein